MFMFELLVLTFISGILTLKELNAGIPPETFVFMFRLAPWTLALPLEPLALILALA